MELGIEGGERPLLQDSRPLLYRVVTDKLVWHDPTVTAILEDTRLVLRPVELTCNPVIRWLVVPPMLGPVQPIRRLLEPLGRGLLHWTTVKIEISIGARQTLHRLTRGHIGPTHLTMAYQATSLASSTTTRACTMMRGCLSMGPTAMDHIAVRNL